MSCIPIGNGYVCGPRMREVTREPAGIKWCFKCRKHLPHDWIVLDSEQPSYYDPIGRYDCPQCHQEHVLFPGRVWEHEL